MSMILIVDDHPDVAETLAQLVRLLGCHPVVCHSGADALRLTQRQPFELMILDNSMPGMTGLDVLRSLGDRTPGPSLPPVLMFSASDEAKPDAMRLGAAGYLLKTDVDGLCDFIEGRCSRGAA